MRKMTNVEIIAVAGLILAVIVGLEQPQKSVLELPMYELGGSGLQVNQDIVKRCNRVLKDNTLAKMSGALKNADPTKIKGNEYLECLMFVTILSGH